MTIGIGHPAAGPAALRMSLVPPPETLQERLDAAAASGADSERSDGPLREQFQNILGELLFGQMLSSMRKNVGKPAYFDGGRAEEIFTQQLDQQLARQMSKQCSAELIGPMYDLTMAGRR